MKRAFGTALLVGALAFGMVSSAWSAGAAAGDQGSTTSSTTTKKSTKKHAKKHTKSKPSTGSGDTTTKQ